VPGRPVAGLEWESSGWRAVVVVSGDFDGVAAPRLEAFLSEHAVAGCTELEVDLAGVPSMGSAGLSVLVGVRRWALQRGIAMRVRGVQPSVWRVFEATGLDGVFASAAVPIAGPPAQDLSLF
jgi:anti-anti-sigma factor